MSKHAVSEDPNICQETNKLKLSEEDHTESAEEDERHCSKPEQSEEQSPVKGRPLKNKLKKGPLSISMPSEFMLGSSAEDDAITSLRSSRVISCEYPSPSKLPPPGKFSRAFSSPEWFPRSQSTDDIAIRRNALHSHSPVHHTWGHLNTPRSDTGRPPSLTAIWESLTVSPLADEPQGSPPLEDHDPPPAPTQSAASSSPAAAAPPRPRPDSGAQ